jgi:arginyl-tRNA synthetase
VVYRISDDNKKVVLRGDGTAVYATQDIALAKLRRDKFAMDRMIYVVGNEQEDYFRQLFSIFKALKYQFWDKAYHLSYGMIELPEGKMKSREGNVIDADTIVDELQSLIKEIVTERYTDWSDEELDQLAEDIALGALKFFILKFDASQNFVFDKKVALSFEGET